MLRLCFAVLNVKVIPQAKIFGDKARKFVLEDSPLSTNAPST